MHTAAPSKYLALAISAVLIAIALVATPVQRASAADAFDGVRDTWRQMLTGGTAYDPSTPAIADRLVGIDAEAQAWWDALDTSPARAALWSDLASPSISSHITGSYVRIRALALAYTTHGSSLEGNTDLAADIVSALDWMQANRYNTTTEKYNNWWDWEIGAPIALNDALILMHPSLTQEKIMLYQSAVNRFTPSVSMTGANRAWTAHVVMGAGVLQKSDSKLSNARDELSPVFDYVTSGDGFYEDGSFIQHELYAYTGSYGAGLLRTLADVMLILKGSQWEVTDPDQEHAYEWVDRAFDPLMVDGAVMDMVRGRELSRHYSQDHVSGHEIITAVLRLSKSAPAPTSDHLKSMVKGWVGQDSYRDYLEFASIDSIVRVLAIQALPSIPDRDDLVGSFVYPSMDRAAFRTPDFSVGFSMYSKRQSAFESANGENLKGWFTSYGATYLYNDDLGYYSDGYWPTVDPYYLPGTTVASVPRSLGAGSNYVNTRAWVGGATVAGQYSAIGQSLEDRAGVSDLAAKKSWFTVGDQVVALGAGITSTTATEIHTTVENRKLQNGDVNAISTNGLPVDPSSEWSKTVGDVRSMLVAGAEKSTNVGYYFPTATSLQLKQETRSGAWSDIDSRTNTPTETITRPYARAAITHGTAPNNAGYAYVMLPGVDDTQLASYTASPSIEVLSNTGELQAVKDVSRGLVAANFWAAEPQQADVISSSGRSSVVVEDKDGVLSIAVSDPTQENPGSVEIELDRTAVSTLAADPRITVTQLNPTIKLSVDVSGAEGGSILSSFAYADEAAQTPSPTDAATPPSTTPDAGVSTPASGSNGTLAATGADSPAPILSLALLLFVAGGVVAVTASRRHAIRGSERVSRGRWARRSWARSRRR